MWESIGIAVLYMLGMGFFHWLGGIGAAAEAIQRWGHAPAERPRRTTPSLVLINIPQPTRPERTSYAVLCLKKKKP